MKAIEIKELIGLDGLELVERPSPKVGKGQVRIKVEAAALNFADLLMLTGQYQDTPPVPFTPGMEAVGTVVEVDDDADGVYLGDRVLAVVGNGAFCEEVVTDSTNCWQAPIGLSSEQAAALPVAYGTADVGLFDRAKLQKGEVLLVHGAAGGVGLAAVQLGKAMGATVVATAGGPEKCALAKENGADFTIDYRDENIRDKVKEYVGGVDVVFDPVGGDVFNQSLRCVNPLSRILVVGFAAGDIQKIPSNHLLVKNVDIQGFYWGAYKKFKPEVLDKSFERIASYAKGGAINPHVGGSYPLAKARDALEFLESRKATGKVIITMGQ